ncbi:hypothetical protein CDAR_43341 [Caerostris darwini]|uniref:Uncharacterized protein n=1 Tax=Caerostris darwini TaxID=1538125 RepID=A0AAV4WIN9_9ARAC|nr:hypothetical protein CDAR_43341 [Caerostris darwini]
MATSGMLEAAHSPENEGKSGNSRRFSARRPPTQPNEDPEGNNGFLFNCANNMTPLNHQLQRQGSLFPGEVYQELGESPKLDERKKWEELEHRGHFCVVHSER